MSEFSVPPITNNLTNFRLLTNISNGPALLNFYNTTTGLVDNQITTKEVNKYFEPNESVFYNTFLVSEETSTLYNKSKLDSYINQGILSDSYYIPVPPTIEMTGVKNNTHSISLSSSLNFLKTISYNSYNHLSLSYVLDSTLTKIRLIVYRDTDGMSYSEDGGLSCIKIPNDGLSYPSEITSFAIQAHDNISHPVAKCRIFIGTLREGLKSFTINKSTSWEVEGSDESTLVSGTHNYFNFKYSITNPPTSTTPITISPDGITYDYIASDFAPCYVIAVNNYPLTAGNGILVYVKNKIIDVVANIQTITETHQYLFKYLHINTKAYTTTAKGYIETPDILNNVKSFTEWTNICDPITRLPIDFNPTNITTGDYRLHNPVTISGSFPILFDQIKQLPYYPSNTYNSTTSGDLFVTAEKNGADYVCNLYSLTATNTIGTADATRRSLSFNKLPSLVSSSIFANKFSGISYETIGTDLFIFITEREAVWYYNLTSGAAWAKLIDASTSLYLDSSLHFTTSANKVTYLSGLTGFTIIKGKNNTLTGIFGSDLGYVQCNIINTLGVLSLNSVGISFKANIHSGLVRDFVSVYGLNNILSCGLETEPITGYNIPNTYTTPIKYDLYTPTVTNNIPSNLSSDSNISTIIYKNYISTESPTDVFYNKYNITYLTTNTDQFLDPLYVYTSTVQANKKLLSIPTYNNYSFPTTLTANNLSYIKATLKHQKLSLLFRTTEIATILGVSSNIESEIQIPFVPEINYQPV